MRKGAEKLSETNFGKIFLRRLKFAKYRKLGEILVNIIKVKRIFFLLQTDDLRGFLCPYCGIVHIPLILIMKSTLMTETNLKWRVITIRIDVPKT